MSDVDVALRHQIKVATRTLHLNDAGAVVLGGMSKQEAYDLLRDCGYSHVKLERMQGGTCSAMIKPREEV